MPLDDYVCKACGHREEDVLHKHKDPAPPCEECGEETEKAITSSSFSLKGGGWFNSGGY